MGRWRNGEEVGGWWEEVEYCRRKEEEGSEGDEGGNRMEFAGEGAVQRGWEGGREEGGGGSDGRGGWVEGGLKE